MTTLPSALRTIFQDVSSYDAFQLQLQTCFDDIWTYREFLLRLPDPTVPVADGTQHVDMLYQVIQFKAKLQKLLLIIRKLYSVYEQQCIAAQGLSHNLETRFPPGSNYQVSLRSNGSHKPISNEYLSASMYTGLYNFFQIPNVLENLNETTLKTLSFQIANSIWKNRPKNVKTWLKIERHG